MHQKSNKQKHDGNMHDFTFYHICFAFNFFGAFF